MKRAFFPSLAVLALLSNQAIAQKLKPADVPATVKSALAKKYPAVPGLTLTAAPGVPISAISWEKEKGNFEANWGGRSKEDTSVLFTPTGEFVEQVVAMSVRDLPPAVATYVKQHYPGAKITEAGKVTDAAGKTRYEAEVKHKDLIFDEAGNFLKPD